MGLLYAGTQKSPSKCVGTCTPQETATVWEDAAVHADRLLLQVERGQSYLLLCRVYHLYRRRPAAEACLSPPPAMWHQALQRSYPLHWLPHLYRTMQLTMLLLSFSCLCRASWTRRSSGKPHSSMRVIYLAQQPGTQGPIYAGSTTPATTAALMCWPCSHLHRPMAMSCPSFCCLHQPAQPVLCIQLGCQPWSHTRIHSHHLLCHRHKSCRCAIGEPMSPSVSQAQVMQAQ